MEMKLESKLFINVENIKALFILKQKIQYKTWGSETLNNLDERENPDGKKQITNPLTSKPSWKNKDEIWNKINVYWTTYLK
ncbi:MAG: hypothetical protein CM15mV92_450 [Caudoviricetes sp.]|nr:MAG: hypothetical protein CM15mV92_450 [Caudoviricetes sp.]